MNDWQPIDTAPKDGTEILVYCADFHPVPVAMHYVSASYLEQEYGDPEHMEQGWYTSHAYDGLPEFAYEPTHWMQLPDPPHSSRG